MIEFRAKSPRKIDCPPCNCTPITGCRFGSRTTTVPDRKAAIEAAKAARLKRKSK